MGLFGDKGGLFGAAKFDGGDPYKPAFAVDEMRRKLSAIDGPTFDEMPPLAEPAAAVLLAEVDPRAFPGGMRPERRRSLPERILGGIGRALTGPDLGTRLAMAQALAGGDTATAARLSLELAEGRRLRERERAAEARRKSAFNNLVKQGMSPADAELAMLDPERFGAAYNARLGASGSEAGAEAGPLEFGHGVPGMADDGQGTESDAVAIGPDGRRYVVRGGRWVPAP